MFSGENFYIDQIKWLRSKSNQTKIYCFDMLRSQIICPCVREHCRNYRQLNLQSRKFQKNTILRQIDEGCRAIRVRDWAGWELQACPGWPLTERINRPPFELLHWFPLFSPKMEKPPCPKSANGPGRDDWTGHWRDSQRNFAISCPDKDASSPRERIDRTYRDKCYRQDRHRCQLQKRLFKVLLFSGKISEWAFQRWISSGRKSESPLAISSLADSKSILWNEPNQQEWAKMVQNWAKMFEIGTVWDRKI